MMKNFEEARKQDFFKNILPPTDLHKPVNPSGDSVDVIEVAKSIFNLMAS